MLLVAMVAAGKDGGLRMQGALLVTAKGVSSGRAQIAVSAAGLGKSSYQSD